MIFTCLILYWCGVPVPFWLWMVSLGMFALYLGGKIVSEYNKK